MARLDRVIVTQDDGALDAVLELAHVSGPGVCLQVVKRRGRQAQRLLVEIMAEPIDEVARQNQRITRALAQGRNGDWKDREAELDTFIDSLDPTSVQTDVQYDNLQGQSFSHPTAEVLLQVFNHTTYHRGQYTAQVRRLGRPSVSTDLIAMLWERDGEGSQTVQPVE